MNIFSNAQAFLGELQPESMENALTEFYKAVAEIKELLGHDSELLDEYAAAVFYATYITNIHEVAIAGFSSCLRELQGLCTGILKGGKKHKDHALYEKAKKIIELNPLPNGENMNRSEVYAGALINDFSKYALEKYYNQYESKLESRGCIARINSLYDRIYGVLGTEEPIEQLNSIIQREFIRVPVMTAFAQGVIDNLLSMLLYKIPETGKYTLEMVMNIIA